jgi:hypothetical protein
MEAAMTVSEVEKIGSPEISRADARAAYLDYKRAVLKAANPSEKKEYEGLWRGYKAIAAGQQVIDVQQAIHTAGIQEDTLFPRLAICRADVRTCRCILKSDGRVDFSDDALRWKYHKRRLSFPAGTLSSYDTRWVQGSMSRYRPSGSLERERWSDEMTAIVPIVPPHLHPRGALAKYVILWDAVWTPAPPKDPLLLKHLAGMLYAIVAHWDLSPLEQAVLRGRL